MTSEVRVYQREDLSKPCKRVLIANSKGGSGKSTLATNLAAAFARKEYETTLVDCDPQETSLFWLNQRSGENPIIYGMSGAPQPSRPTLDWFLRVPRTTERLVIDSPGDIDSARLTSMVDKVDLILVPLLPSAIDIHATTEFIKNIFLTGSFRNSGKQIFVVGNRVHRRNKYFHQLNRFLRALNISDIIHLPDSYVFLRCADEGLGVIDLEPGNPRIRREYRAVEHLVETVETALNREEQTV
ncbi:MAG: ParA family protein [Porticoccaceae bacterium]|jgi:chromosome partitioning protein|nr:ParA family protein [Porticoccaceae bacterium]